MASIALTILITVAMIPFSAFCLMMWKCGDYAKSIDPFFTCFWLLGVLGYAAVMMRVWA